MPEKQILKQKPQINISTPSGVRMCLVAGCAFLCVCQSALTDNGRSLVIALTVLLTAVILELLLTRKKYGMSKIKDGSAAAAAMVLTLLLPNMIHPVYAALGAAFAIVVVKYSFGGLGANWMNPALGGWLFIRFCWPASFAGALDNSVSLEIGGLMPPIESVNAVLTAFTGFLNDTVFSILKVRLPDGYIDLLFSGSPGIIADRGLFALLAGTVIITAAGISRGWAALVFISVYCFLIRLAGDLDGGLWNGDMLYGLFSGGTIAAAFILAAEPASGAKLFLGVLISIIISAVLSWVFRYRLNEFTGCFIAFIIINCFTPVIRLAEDKFLQSGKNKIVINSGREDIYG